MRGLAYYTLMSGDRTKQAIARIEGALARIEAAAARPRASAAPSRAEVPASVSQLVEKHESLRETVTITLRDLDDLITKAEV